MSLSLLPSFPLEISSYGSFDDEQSRRNYGPHRLRYHSAAMEDAHTAVLSLDEDSADPNTFFAVYDGHGGKLPFPFRSTIPHRRMFSTSVGSAVAKYAGVHVHKRLIQDEAYQKKDYTLALKNAFLNTDAEMKNSTSCTVSCDPPSADLIFRIGPEFTREPSGCTAVAALVTNEGKVYVVRTHR